MQMIYYMEDFMKVKYLPIFVMSVIISTFFVTSCDLGDNKFSNSNFIGYWRSENSYKSGTYNYYDIYIFKNNTYTNFGTNNYNNVSDRDDWPTWDKYTVENNKIFLHSHYSSDDYEYYSIDKYPFYFLNGDLYITFSEFKASVMGLTDRTVRYIKFK